MRKILFSLFLCSSISLSAQNVSFISTGVTSASACLGQQTTFVGSSAYADTSVASWLWDFDNDGLYDDGFGKMHGFTFSQPGSYPVGLKVVLNSGAVDSMPLPDTVMVNPLPEVNFVTDNLCEGQTAVFTSASTISSGSISQFYWDFRNDGSDNDSGATATFNCGPAETYQTRLRCISDQGCEAFTIKTTQVFHQPVPGFTVQSACLGGNTAFTNTSTLQDENISFYIWDFGDGDSSAAANPTHTFPSEQAYIVKLTAVSENACKATFSDSIDIIKLVNADFSVQNTCLGGTTQFADNTTTLQGEVISSFQWDFGDATTGMTSGNASHEYAATGTYTVTLTAVSQNSCKDSKTSSLTIASLVNAGFSAQNACLGEATAFTNTSTLLQGETISSLVWNFGDGTSGTTSGNTSHEYSATGTYTVSLVTVSQNGCKDTAAANVTVNQLPVVTLEISGDTINDSTIYEGNEITLDVDGSASSYLWSTGETTSSISVADSGTYSVTSTNSNGCSQTLSKKIIIKDIPDAVVAGNDIITPNGDGINDAFVIMDVSGYKQCALNIYTIWNEEVYSSTGYKNDWDGKNKNGKDLDAGAYYYILKCDDKEQALGTVNILR